jgi:hypothetical protein
MTHHSDGDDGRMEGTKGKEAVFKRRYLLKESGMLRELTNHINCSLLS